MDPVERDDHNYVYRGEHERDGEIVNPGVGDLSCRIEDAYTYAHFIPSDEELEQLKKGGVIELHVIGHPIPPLGLTVVARNAPASTNGDIPHD